MTDYQILHSIFNKLTRYKYPYVEADIPQNGIYVLFEKGEKFKDFDRVVRVGSHTGANRLFERINEHYIGDDHRDSIFRKHLGRCFLTLDEKTDYIKNWDLKIKRREDKAKNLSKINWELERQYEQRITDHVQQNFTFVVVPDLLEKQNRLRLEKGIIATLARAAEKLSSSNWLGNYHPDTKIRTSRLWNVQHLSDPRLKEEEIALIIEKSADNHHSFDTK